MELTYNRREKIVGTFIFCIAILLLSTVVIIGRGQDWFKKHITYYTTFDESYDLKKNAAVKLFKADIGKIKNITLVGNKVKITLSILEEYASRIRIDSIAMAESMTFIGNEYISIKPGSTDAPLIPKGGEIPSKAKRSITDILTEFEVEKTAKMVIKAAQNLSEFVHVLKDPKGPLFTALDNINIILSDIEAGKGSVGSLLKSRELIDKVGDILDDVDDATSKAPQTMDHVNYSLTNIRNASDKLKVILTNVEKGSYDLPEVTKSTKRGIQEIRDEIENIDKVVKSLQKNFLIRSNLPPELEGENTDAGLRE